MATKSLDIGPLAVAVTVALIGGLPLVWLLTQPDSERRNGTTAPGSTVTTAAVTEPATVSLVAPEPEVETAELHPSIVKVLETTGFARATGRTELETLLGAPILNVLIANGAVLTVADDIDLAPVDPPEAAE